MNIVNSGGKYNVYGSSIQTYDKLPANTYQVCFNDREGFYLIAHSDLNVTEKVYGSCLEKIDKTLKSFAAMSRNMGVILSGPKGSGKSVFARMLAVKAHEIGLPVLLVTEAMGGLSGFISSIQQECIVIFDEFEKVFNMDTHSGESIQHELLSLFDGLDNGKKLYIITCNNTRGLSSYMLNRPGRFHYHFIVSGPDDEAVREYMQDHLNPEAQQYVEDVVELARNIECTYDILRAISFELNQGYSMQEAMADLNVEEDANVNFTITIHFANGQCAVSEEPGVNVSLHSYRCEDFLAAFTNPGNPEKHGRPSDTLRFAFLTQNIYFDGGAYHIDPDKLTFCRIYELENCDDEDPRLERFYEDYKITKVELRRNSNYSSHTHKFPY